MRTILVTGATGVIGSALVPRLLADADTQLRLLIRADGDAHLAARLAELRAFWDTDVSDEQFARITALAGDVCEPQLGLTGDVYSRLAGEVTHVVHAAGNVKLNLSLAEARRYAVGGLQNVVAFCHAARQAGQFQKLDYVSTVGVAGRMPGLIPERRLTEPRAFHNSYEQGKAEAEDYLFGEMDKGLAATIHRPSMVVGDSRTGKMLRPQVFHYICEFLSGSRTFGIVPDLRGKHLDIVPVDYVVELIARSVALHETAGRVFHQCSGPNGVLDLGELSTRIQQSKWQTNKHLRPPYRISLRLFCGLARLARLVAAPGRLRMVVGALPQLIAYLDECQAFVTIETGRMATSLGVHVPTPTECLNAVLPPGFYAGDEDELAPKSSNQAQDIPLEKKRTALRIHPRAVSESR